MALDIMRMASHVRQGFEDGAERKRKETTRKLLGMSMQGDQDSLKELYGVDPAAAQQVKTQQQAMHKEVADLMWRGATAIKQAPPEQKAQIYAAVRAEVAKHPESREWTAMLPPQYDPAQVDPAVEQLLAQTGLYQSQPKEQGSPAGLRQFEAMAANAGLQKGTPEYMKAAQIYLGQEARARNQVYESDNGANVITMGGGNMPTAAPVMTAPVEAAPIYNGGGAVNAGVAISDPNGDFSSLNPIEKAKFNSFSQQGKPFQIIDGKVIPGTSAGVQLRPPTKPTEEIKNLPTGMRMGANGVAEWIPGVTPSGSGVSKPMSQKEIKAFNTQKAQLPALKRRIESIVTEFENVSKNSFLDGGPLDGKMLSLTGSGQKLDAAIAQLKPLLLAFTRVPGIGAQSDFEARIDGMQYPSTSNYPETNKLLIKELKQFIQDLNSAYENTDVRQAAPANPSGKKDYSGLF